MCICVGFVICGCFGNTCIYSVLYCLYCFVYIYFLFVLFVLVQGLLPPSEKVVVVVVVVVMVVAVAVVVVVVLIAVVLVMNLVQMLYFITTSCNTGVISCRLTDKHTVGALHW